MYGYFNAYTKIIFGYLMIMTYKSSCLVELKIYRHLQYRNVVFEFIAVLQIGHSIQLELSRE